MKKHRFSMALTALALISFFSVWVNAATYNFSFNNTEQGDNSSSNPTVNVAPKQGEDEAANNLKELAGPLETKPNSEDKPAAEAARSEEAQMQANSNVAGVSPVASASRTRHFRLAGAFGATFLDEFYDDGSGSSFSNRAGGNTYFLEVGLFATSWLGVNAWGGWRVFSGDDSLIWGAEWELTPVAVRLFGIDDFVTVGLLMGVNGVPVNDNDVTLHGGARVGLNLAQHVGLYGSFRGNMGFTQVNAGMQFRF